MEDSVTSDTLYFLIAENRLFRSKAKEGWKGWLLKERLRSSKPFFLSDTFVRERIPCSLAGIQRENKKVLGQSLYNFLLG